MGGGLILPMAMAIVSGVFPPEERGVAVGIIGIGIALGPTLGPIIGGQIEVWFNWRGSFVFLTALGLVALVAEGFKLPVMRNPEPEGAPFLHSDRFVVTDAEARIRGFYPSLEDGGIERLVADLRVLARSP